MTSIRLWAALFILCFLRCSDNDNSLSPDNLNEFVRDEYSENISTKGAKMRLGDIGSLVFEKGSFDSESKVTVRLLDQKAFFDTEVAHRVVLACSSALEFSKPVVFKIPIPDGLSPEDSVSFSAGYLDTAEGFHPVAFTIDRSSTPKRLIVSASHFSPWVFDFFKAPPDSARLEVPYYNQGSTNYCWATSLQMVTEAVSHSSLKEIFSIIGEVGVDEEGVKGGTFRYGTSIKSVVRVRTGVAPERSIWHTLELGNYRMENFLRREVGLRRHPVAIHSSGGNHAYVVVGYNKTRFYIHDPNATGGGVASIPKTWAAITAKHGLTDQFVTLAVPKSLGAARPLYTLNIPHGNPGVSSIYFKQSKPKPDFQVFQWTHKQKRGYQFYSSQKAKPQDTIPSTVDDFNIADIEVSNATGSSVKAKVAWDILELKDKKSRYYTSKSVTVPAYSISHVKFPLFL